MFILEVYGFGKLICYAVEDDGINRRGSGGGKVRIARRERLTLPVIFRYRVLFCYIT
jgi:hypothetical protein